RKGSVGRNPKSIRRPAIEGHMGPKLYGFLRDAPLSAPHDRQGCSGSSRSNGGAKRRVSLGSALSASLTASFRQSRCYTRCPVTASTPKPEGGARCVSSARRDLCGLCLVSAFDSAA